MTTAATSVGQALRAARGKRSLRSLADALEVNFTHICRIESGERMATPELVERIAAALQVPAGPLLELTATLSDDVVNSLADPDLRLAVGPAALPEASRDALRRRHLAEIATRIRVRAGASRVPIDPQTVADTLGARIRGAAVGEPPVVIDVDQRMVTVLRDESSSRSRFLFVHGISHLALDHDAGCDVYYDDRDERDATTLTSFLLVPEAELQDFTRAETGKHDMWDPDGASLVMKAAGRFDVPLWMVARRLAEGGRLAQMAEVHEL